MPRFMFLYTGEAPIVSDLPPEQATAILNSWQYWGQDIGNALIDIGTPFANGMEQVATGVQTHPLPMNGYAIVQAEDMAQALALAQTHPFLSDKRSWLSISVFELVTEPPAASAPSQVIPEVVNVEQTATPPPPPGTLPAIPEEPASPPPAPGELTIPHEQPQEEQPSDTSSLPPVPGQGPT